MGKKICLFISILFCLLICSCTSTRVDEQVLEYQRQIDRLEESIRSRDRAIEECIRELEALTTRSESMGTEIDDLIRELDEYHSAVERLLQCYRGQESSDNSIE